jgi:uncharacterized protein
MIKIIPDTSFLISCAEFKIDWEKEFHRVLNEKFEIIIIENVLKEIEKLIEQGGKKRKEAKLTKTIITTKKYKIKKGEEKHTDDVLFELSNKFLIATQDNELKKRIKKKGNKIGYIRQKKYVNVE